MIKPCMSIFPGALPKGPSLQHGFKMVDVKVHTQFVTQHQNPDDVLQTARVDLADRQLESVEKLHDDFRDGKR